MFERLARIRGAVHQRAHDPVAWTDLFQLLKTAVAAVLAWVLADAVFGLPQSFLAPWAALLVVHATVYRTFSRGLQDVGAAVLGVLLAWGVGHVFGRARQAQRLGAVAGLAVGASVWFEEDATAIAATGLVVLTTGFSQDQMLLDRLFDTGIGIAAGLTINSVVWPPLRDRSAARAIDRIDDGVGELLRDMAERLQGPCTEEDAAQWVDRTRELDTLIDDSWAFLRQARESSRLNLRRAAKGVRAADVHEQILRDNEQAVAEARSMARTLGHSITDLREWDRGFKKRWLSLLAEAGDAICAPDAGRVAQVRVGLAHLADELSTADLPGRYWPEYGALIMNLRNVVTSMDRVAEANPVGLPRRSLVRG